MFHSLLMAFSCGYSEKYVTQMNKYDVLHFYLLFIKGIQEQQQPQKNKNIVIVTNMLLCKYQEKKMLMFSSRGSLLL